MSKDGLRGHRSRRSKEQELKRDVSCATATPKPPAQLPGAGGSGAPRALSQTRLRAHAGRATSLLPRGKADCQTFVFYIITCSPLKWFAYHQRYTHPARGPPRQDQTFYSCQRQACCRKWEKRQKISWFCYTLDFEAAKGEGIKKEKKKL